MIIVSIVTSFYGDWVSAIQSQTDYDLARGFLRYFQPIELARPYARRPRCRNGVAIRGSEAGRWYGSGG
jgi:hypothetical protein